MKFEYSLLITEEGSWDTVGRTWSGNVFDYPDGLALFTGGTAISDNCAVVPQTDTYLSMNTAGIVPPQDSFGAGKADAEARLAARTADPNQPPTTENGFAFPTGELVAGSYSSNGAWGVQFLTVPLTCVYDAASEVAAGNPIPVEIVIGDLNDNEIPPAAAFKASSVRWSNSPTPAQEARLDLTRSGTGSGTVTSSPAGIDCGSTCGTNFTLNSTVTLTATAASGSTFTGWSGSGCSGTGTCVVTMSEARSVTATFTADTPPVTRQLSVSKSGTGEGSVTSTPAGIDCGATCTAEFEADSTVTLTASAASGSTFTGWSGACSGTGTCEVTMSEARSVDAAFAADPPTPSGKPSLKVSFTTPKRVIGGKRFAVKVKVSNGKNAGSAAKSVRSCLKVPSPLIIVKAKGAKVSGRSVCWTRSTLDIGRSVTYPVTLRAPLSASGVKSIRARVTAENAAGQSASGSGRAAISVKKGKAPRPKPPTG